MSDPLVTQVTAMMPELRRYALRLAKDTSDADDLVQDCMVRALSRLELFERGTNLEAWLTTILRNLFLNRCKQAKRHAEAVMPVEDTIEAPQARRVELRETARAFASLSKGERDLVRLCGLEGCSYKAVAARLGVTMGTVRSRLSRARARLRDLAANPRREEAGREPPRNAAPPAPAGSEAVAPPARQQVPSPLPDLARGTRRLATPTPRHSSRGILAPWAARRPERRLRVPRGWVGGPAAALPPASVPQPAALWAVPPPRATPGDHRPGRTGLSAGP